MAYDIYRHLNYDETVSQHLEFRTNEISNNDPIVICFRVNMWDKNNEIIRYYFQTYEECVMFLSICGYNVGEVIDILDSDHNLLYVDVNTGIVKSGYRMYDGTILEFDPDMKQYVVKTS